MRADHADPGRLERPGDLGLVRRAPQPDGQRAGVGELAAEPWYPVAANDIFPEEFAAFLLVDPRVKAAFLAHHADLLDAGFWIDTQRKLAQGHIEDVFPYPQELRFRRRFGTGAHK